MFNNKFYLLINFIIEIFILFFIDKDEIYNNPNFHSEEQDELEIPDGNYNLIEIIMF